MSSITWDDPLLEKFNFASSDQTKVTAIIAHVDAAVDTYCKRNLAEAEYSRLCPVLSNGDVHLRAYPVSRLIRVQHERIEVLTIRASASIGVATTGSAAIFLQSLSGGSLVPTTLVYASYPTLGALATAISLVSGFTATVDASYSDYPSADLVPGIQIENDLMRFPIFIGKGEFSVDAQNGILKLGFKSYDQIKVKWVGGFADYPEDLKGVIADTVGNIAQGKIGQVTSETFGGEYSYTISPISLHSLPVSNRVILDSYKDRS